MCTVLTNYFTATTPGRFRDYDRGGKGDVDVDVAAEAVAARCSCSTREVADFQ